MSQSVSTALVAFVPVIHKGYLDFFSKNKGDIRILGDDVVEIYVHLMRDLRRIPTVDAITALQAIFPKRSVKAISLVDLKNWKYKKTIMPQDEISTDIMTRYFKKKKVSFQSIFLRWNRVITLVESEIKPGTKISNEEFHKKILKQAEVNAQKSADWWRQIGACIIKDEQIIIQSYNHHLPSDFHMSVAGDPRSNFDAGQRQEIFTSIHAEAAAIAEAAEKGISLKGTSIYVTTFPCPNCARLMAKSGIKKVYYSKGYSLFDAQKILDHFEIEVVLVK